MNALVSKEFWNERYSHMCFKYITPQPKKYYLDFKLDRVFCSMAWMGACKWATEAGCG